MPHRVVEPVHCWSLDALFELGTHMRIWLASNQGCGPKGYPCLTF